MLERREGWAAVSTIGWGLWRTEQELMSSAHFGYERPVSV